MRRALLSFLAGFAATLLCHQPMLWLLHLAGATPRMPYAMKPVPPFGVPSVISLAFWGGVWGIIMILALARTRGASYWTSSAIFGAFLPTLVAAFVIAPLRGALPPAGGRMTALLIGFAINAVWGLGTAAFYRMFNGGRR